MFKKIKLHGIIMILKLFLSVAIRICVPEAVYEECLRMRDNVSAIPNPLATVIRIYMFGINLREKACKCTQTL